MALKKRQEAGVEVAEVKFRFSLEVMTIDRIKNECIRRTYGEVGTPRQEVTKYIFEFSERE